MSTNNSELDFQNYNLKDILKLFKISNNICDDDLVNSRKKLLQLKHAKLNQKYTAYLISVTQLYSLFINMRLYEINKTRL